jgi:uncharacterized protein (DUF1786 family)
MKLLTFDIGTGTKDILLYDSERKLENCLKMVVPSPTVVNSAVLDEINEDIYLDGEIVGGGPLVHSAMRVKKRGHKVGFSPRAANAVKNDNFRVQEMGFHVGENPGWRTLTLDEHHLDTYFKFFELFGERREQLDGLGLCVQDHGKAGAGETDRTFRFNTFIEHLDRNPTLDVFTYTAENLPPYFMRMQAGVDAFKAACPGKKIVVMDTCIAAMRGCLAYKPTRGPAMVLNCGNSHSMAGIIVDNRIVALFEHHTKFLKKDPQKYVYYLTGLADGTIDPQEVFDDEGEGAIVREKVGIENITDFLYTGPRRGLLDGLNFPFRCKPEIAVPGGDMMMTGPVGVVDGYRKVFGLDLPLY